MSMSLLFRSPPIHSEDESMSYEEDSSSVEDDALRPTSTMSTTSDPVPSLISDETTSSEEDSSSEENDVPWMVDHNRDDRETGEEESSSESSESSEDDAPRIGDHSRSNSVSWQGNTSSAVLMRQIPEPMFFETTQERTRRNMFGVTNTEFVRIDITDPVLYIALYSTGGASSEVDEYHWAFIVGPSREEADSKGTLYSMEPRQAPGLKHPYGGEWCWLYNQTTVPLRGQSALLARLMIAEIADMDMWQAVVLRWGSKICMREHVEWMSVKWVQNILQTLDEEEGCLGRRMESFDSVEAEGRWLAGTEEEKRKGFRLLDARINTRILFERQTASALMSTATVEIAITNPVLYVAVYKTNRDSQQWAFLIGPSVETAQSEGVRCGVEPQIDSDGWGTWLYNQVIVPLWYEDDLLARIMIAEIKNLAPLGAILHNQEATPTVEVANSAGDVALTSFGSNAWVWKIVEVLEKKPECLAMRRNALRMLEEAGCRVSVNQCQISVDELLERLSSKDRRRTKRTLSAIELKTLELVDDRKKPDEHKADLIVDPNLERGQPVTLSESFQVITGVLGAAALETRESVAWKRWLATSEQERKAGVEPDENGNALVSFQRTRLEEDDEDEDADADEEEEDEDEDDAGALTTLERSPTTFSFI